MPRHHMMSVKHNNRSSVGLLRILKVNQENKYKDKQRESFCVSPRSTLHIETFFRQVSRLFLHSQSSKHNIYIYIKYCTVFQQAPFINSLVFIASVYKYQKYYYIRNTGFLMYLLLVLHLLSLYCTHPHAAV